MPSRTIDRKPFAWLFSLLLLATSWIAASSFPQTVQAALLGVDTGQPLIQSAGPVQGIFNTGTGRFSVSATPQLFIANNQATAIGSPASMCLDILVNSDGTLVGGTSSCNGSDLEITGDIGSGHQTLLTGDILAFGFMNASSGTVDRFDFRFRVTGGLLAPAYLGSDIGVVIPLEQSTFNGSFDTNFNGLPKPNVGLTLPAPAGLGDYVWDDLNGDGIQNDGDTGVSSVPVSLTNCVGGPALDFDGNQVSATATNASGLYQFTNLRPYVDYCVEFTPPAGYEFTVQSAPGSTDEDDSNPDPVSGTTPPVNLDSGEFDPTIDAGLIKPAALGNYLWEDLNRNGIQDEPAASGINGQDVYLRDCAGGLLQTKQTANDGSGNPGYYLFDNLMPGCYLVEFTKPAGFVFTEKNAPGSLSATDSDADQGTGRTVQIDLQSGETDLTWDAGVYEPIEPKLGDYVWEDLDGDGIQDTDEPGINGVTVKLYECGNPNAIATTTTANDSANNPGYYLFTAPDVDVNGCYQVEFERPVNYCAGAEFTSRQAGDSSLDSDGSLSDQVFLTAPDSLVNLTVDAGVICPAALGNYLWEDLNRNGVQDEQPNSGINGQEVFLLDCAGGQLDSTFTANDGSDNPGYYLFDNLMPGCYLVEFTKPAGFVFTEKNAPGSLSANDSDADQGTGQTGPIDLESGETDLTWDAGIYEPIEPKLGDYVWEDKNGDGIQDPEEPGINGADVNLYDCQGNFIATTTTADDSGSKPGYYLFAAPDVNVNGCYQVEFEEPVNYCAGAEFTTRQAGDSSFDSDGPLSDQVFLIPPDSLVNLTIDAGVLCPAALGDYVWEDLNNDGMQNEPASAGLNGIIVDLLEPGVDNLCNTGDESILESTITANDAVGNPGYYLFGPLDLGSYCVEINKPQDFECTKPNVGPNQPSPVDSDVAEPGTLPLGTCQTDDPVENPIDLQSGEVDLYWDAGLYRPAEIGNEVFEDTNRNGVRDAGEPGIPGATITISGPNGYSDSATTGADGLYLFDNLVPGDYTLSCVAPAGYSYTTPFDQGSTTDKDSNASPADGGMGTHTLASGDSNLTIDCGLYQPPAEIGNEVFEDTNRNGVRDAGEPGIPGATITISGPNGYSDSATTGADGLYLFDNLVPGDYTLSCVAPAGYSYTTPFDQGSTTDKDSNANPADGGMGTHTLASGDSNLTIDCGLYRPVVCEVCIGVDSLTLKISAAAWNRDQNETVRVRANSANGPVLFSGKVPTGGSFSIDPPLLEGVMEIYVTVQGIYHPQETVKAHFLTNCDLAIGATDGNSYITFKVTELTQDFEVDPTGAACAGGMVCGQKFEAENGDLSGLFGVYQGSSFSGGAYVKTLDNGLFESGLTNNYVRFNLQLDSAKLVKFKTGVYSPSGNSDSFLVTIDGQPADGYLYDTASGGLVADYVNDRNGRDGGDPVAVQLAAGGHTLTFYMREDGTKLDWVEAVCDSVVTPAPSIDIRKQAEGPDSRTFSPGDTVPFEIVVTNTGNVDMSNVVVSDALVPNCDNTIGSLAAGGSVSYTCQTVLPSGGVTKTYRDEFNSKSYNNNDGTDHFSGPWLEDDKNDGYTQNPLYGNVLIGSNYKLWLDDNPDTGTMPSAARAADLSGANTATLSFDWETHSGVDTSDAVVVEVSSDGGANYTVLKTFTGFSGARTGSESFDISGYASADTTIRFRVSANYGGISETFKVDNVTITAETGGGATGFNNEACVSGEYSGQSINDCDTSEVVIVDEAPSDHKDYKHIWVSHSGKCLDVSGVSMDNGAKVHQWDCHGGDNQAWELIPHSSGAYQLRAKHSGKCLDGYWAASQGDDLKQWSCASSSDNWISNQLFQVTQHSDGSYKLKHTSGKCLDVSGSSTANGAGIILWSDTASSNQRWKWN